MAPRIVLVSLLVAVVPMLGCGTGRPESPLDVARELLFQQEFDDALAHCDQFLDSTPDSLNAWLLRGEINQKWGNTEEALADYTKAIAVEPDNPEGYYYRGKLYGYLGDTEMQRADEFQARELDVQSRLAYSIEFTPPMPNSVSSRDRNEESSDEETASGNQDTIADLDPARDPLVDSKQNRLAVTDDTQGSAGGEVTGSAQASRQSPALDTPYKRLLAKQAAKRRQMEDLDLQSVPAATPTDDRNFEADQDDSADPGGLEDQDAVEPSPRNTRFGLQFGDQLPGFTTGRREVSTGISAGDVPSQPRGRFFLQPRGQIGGSSVMRPASPPTTGISSRPRNQETPNGAAGWMRLPSPIPGAPLPLGPRRQLGGTASVWPPSGGAGAPTTALPGTAPPSARLPESTTWPFTALPSGSSTSAPGSTWGVIPPPTTGVRGGSR